MEPILGEVLKLAEIDKQLVALKKRLDGGPRELARQRTAVEAAKAERGEVEKRIREAMTEVDQCSLDLKTYEAELADQEEKLSICKNNKEYKILTDRIKTLKQAISDLETKELTVMESLDAMRAELKGKTEAMQAAEAKVAGLEGEIGQEAEGIKLEQKGLAKQRHAQAKVIEGMDEDLMKVYNRALARGKGEALAEFKDGNCQACYRKASPQLRNTVAVGKDLANCLCGGCGRILITSRPTPAT